MKNKILSIILTTSMLTFNNLKSQVVNYVFNQSNTTYSVVNTGTQIGTVLQDDNTNTVNLPFTFDYNGSPYNNVYVHSNGFISFSMAQIDEYFPISNNTQNVISAFGQDLYMGTATMGKLTAGSNTITNVTNISNIQIGDSLLDYNNDFGVLYPKVTAINGNNIVLNLNSTNTNSIYDLFF